MFCCGDCVLPIRYGEGGHEDCNPIKILDIRKAKA